MMGKPATVILAVTSIAVLGVLHRAPLVSALDDPRIVREQDSNNAHGAPEIDTVEEQITLPKGASWNFTCKSHQPIMWKHYAASYYWEPMYEPPHDFQTDDPDKPYGSVLMLTDASADLVGRYYCVHVEAYDEELEDKLDDLVAEYAASTVYVYVNDPEQPLVPVHSPVFRVNQYEDFVIPCKPTHPDIEVALFKDLEGDLVEDYQYSNTQGYLLSFNRLEDGGSYYCQVKDKPQHRIHFEISINEHCEFTATNGTRFRRTFQQRKRPEGIHSNALYIAGDGVTALHNDISTTFSDDDDNTGNWLARVFAMRSELLTERSRSDESLPSSGHPLDDLPFPDTGAVAKFKRSILDPFENDTSNGTIQGDGLEDPMRFGNNMTEGNSTSTDNFTYLYDYLDEATSNETVAGTSVGYVNATEDRPTTPRTYAHVYPHGENSSHVPLTSTIPPVAEYIMKPTIRSDTKDHIPLGQRIRLVCKVNIRAGVNLEMTWLVPPKLQPAVKDGRTKIGPLKVEPVTDAEHREIASRELIIERAAATDDGTYRCVVKDLNNHQNYHSFKLHVRDSAEDYVMLREENNLAEINVRPNANGKADPINIVIEYRSHPANITYYWVKDDQEIMAGHHGKYELTHTETHVKLRITNPEVYDTGNYTVFVMAGNAEKSQRMAVLVYAKPILHMESKFVKPNEEVSFQCRSIGFPRPDISFAFLPCLAEPWTNCSIPSAKDSRWDSPGGKPETQITKSRIYTTVPKQPGVVYCKAINTEGSEVTQADLLVSDLPDSITLEKEQPKEAITVGDHVTIVCSALVYNHTKDITIVLNDRELQESDGVRLQYSPTLYAWQARLDIDHVTNDHEGTVYCRVRTLANIVETRAFHMEVLDPIAPMLVSGKINQSLSVDLHDPLKLECDVVGTPDPKVVWLKDGEPVQQEENSNRVQLTKTTLIFEYLKMEDLGTFECRAENKMGSIEKYWKLDVRTTVVRKSLIYIIVCLFLLLIVAIVMVSLFYCKKKKEVKAMKEAGIVNFEEGNLGVYNPELALDEQADLLPYNSEYEFPKERLKLGKQLGTGAFGVVMKATATRIMVNEDDTTVAVKMVKKQTDNEVMRALISELKIMVHLGQHLNVVNLLGAVTKNIAKRELMVIVEYCRFGNVQNFLLKHRPYFIDQINQETGEIDSSIDKNQLRWSKCGYQYNSQGLKYVNLSFSTNNVNHHPLQHPTAFYHNHIDSGSTQYVDPKKHLNSKGYVRHSGLQNMGMVDSCNTEVTAMTSVEVEDLNTVNSNEPLWRSNYGMDYKGPARSVNTTDLVCWASQIASGMEYLASRKVLHGDLAARNILLCDDNVVKICDFGLARSMYKSDNYKKKGESPLPFKWLALECISDNLFSTYSDAWAYGIVLWELFSLGKVPYPGMEANQELYNKLRDGYRMDKPQYSNQDIYDIMLNCWNVKPDSRPSFKDLKSRFNAMLPDEMRDHYLELNEPYLQMNAEKQERGDTDYLANLGPPEELAPAAPNYVNGIILPLPPISEIQNNKDYLKMSRAKSESQESNFDFASFNSDRHSPTTRNNLDTSPPNGSKRHKKLGLPEEIPMLDGSRLSSNMNGFNSDSETEPVSPKPRERTSKHNPEPQYINVKNPKFAGRSASDEMGPGIAQEAISNPGYIALSMVDEKRC
ncbi:vascular endothelial growth factor receptor 1 [Anopheles moucheti]|uniref:vascular endothelial growth factor receptor 1 n=1 Tax=Anopheles moucheti TaxID=186751 RepID=UPI0022F02C41|nr:vascular endothelial growth factor receptor 1 [Anopheles moucheti]